MVQNTGSSRGSFILFILSSTIIVKEFLIVRYKEAENSVFQTILSVRVCVGGIKEVSEGGIEIEGY